MREVFCGIRHAHDRPALYLLNLLRLGKLKHPVNHVGVCCQYGAVYAKALRWLNAARRLTCHSDKNDRSVVKPKTFQRGRFFS
jgi:hypothetical protein